MAANPQALHAGFLAILPRIERYARTSFRHVRCPHWREDALQEVRALTWKWYVGAVRRGKDPSRFVAALAAYAARHVRSGRKVCGTEPAQDVLFLLAQQRHGFAAGKLTDLESPSGHPLADALADNTQTPVDEQVCFRCDFPRWRGTLCDRNRLIADDLMQGERTGAVADRYRLSPCRASLLWREFWEDWRRFCGEPVSN